MPRSDTVRPTSPDSALSQLRHARRIALVGSPGAGKSRLAIQLGELLDLPVCHLDRLWWRPGWVEAGEEAFDAALRDVVGSEAWIIDGNYSRTLHVRLTRAEAAIMLDFPRTLCLYRVLQRGVLHRGATRPDMALGCPERIDWEFLRFVWDYPRRSRPRVLEKLHAFGETKTFIHVRHPREVRLLLEGLTASA